MVFQSFDQIDWLDQVAHFAVGLVLVLAIGFFTTWWIAVIVSILVAGIRETWQHPWTCHEGCRTDLLFWLIGSLVGAGIVEVIR